MKGSKIDVSFWQQKLILLRSKKDSSGCWIWKGHVGKGGYGLLRYGRFNMRAHRLSYEAFKGSFDNSLLVCHTCDNPTCVNPDHLFLGTTKDNTYDSINKGRFHQLFTKGNLPENSKIKDAQKVKEIRQAIAKGVPVSDIASTCGVPVHIVKDIKRGRSYQNVA